MDVRLSAEQVALADSAAQVVDRLGPTTTAAVGDHDRVARLDAAVTTSGWRELRADQGDEPADRPGAPWASGVEVAIVAEQLGRGLADVAFVGPTLAAELRRRAGAPAAPYPETVLLSPGLATLAAFDGEMAAPGAVAIDAAGASRALALVATDVGTWILVEVPVELRADWHADPIDLTRPSGQVAAAAGAVTPVGRWSLSDDDLAAVTALGLATACADLVGVLRGAVALATSYAADRRQYGVAVGSFQAVQHLLADAHVASEGAYSVALHAAWAVDALAPAAALSAASVAKAYCARAARDGCETAIQVHGGIGNTWECLAHVFLRRALLSAELLGGIGPSLERLLAHRGIAATTSGRP